jgi:crossover junction endodeoxyribonuclease RuvC
VENLPPRIILGIDPGTVVTGYALIRVQGRDITPLDFGCIRPPSKALLSERYHVIYKSLLHLIKTHGPTEVAIETPFINKNPQSALKLGSALGCAIIAAKEHSLPIFGYAPSEVKRGITSRGDASKEDVAAILCSTLRIKSGFRLDASDALSIALYHEGRALSKPSKEL